MSLLSSERAALSLLAKFFYFAFTTEAHAKRAAKAASSELLRLQVTPSRFVFVTRKYWEKFRRNSHSSSSYSVTKGQRTGGGWLPPENVDLSIWSDFQKSAEEDELLTVIWLHLLGLDESDISKGLGVTRGTVRYRASRGLRKIGSLSFESEQLQESPRER